MLRILILVGVGQLGGACLAETLESPGPEEILKASEFELIQWIVSLESADSSTRSEACDALQGTLDRAGKNAFSGWSARRALLILDSLCQYGDAEAIELVKRRYRETPKGSPMQMNFFCALWRHEIEREISRLELEKKLPLRLRPSKGKLPDNVAAAGPKLKRAYRLVAALAAEEERARPVLSEHERTPIGPRTPNRDEFTPYRDLLIIGQEKHNRQVEGLYLDFCGTSLGYSVQRDRALALIRLRQDEPAAALSLLLGPACGNTWVAMAEQYHANPGVSWSVKRELDWLRDITKRMGQDWEELTLGNVLRGKQSWVAITALAEHGAVESVELLLKANELPRHAYFTNSWRDSGTLARIIDRHEASKNGEALPWLIKSPLPAPLRKKARSQLERLLKVKGDRATPHYARLQLDRL